MVRLHAAILVAAITAVTAAAQPSLSGWYVGSESGSSFNPNTGNWSSAASYSYYRFFPDGRVFWAWNPPRGMTMDEFDSSPNPSAMGNHGTYTISGGRIHFTWAIKGRSPEHWPFTRSADWVSLAGTYYYRIKPAAGTRLSGSWGTSSYAATSRGSGVSGSRTVVFMPDGTFRRTGFVGSVNGGPAAAGATSRSSADAGSYRVTGNTLELTAGNGRREKHSFYRYPNEENKLLVIDGAFYLKRN